MQNWISKSGHRLRKNVSGLHTPHTRTIAPALELVSQFAGEGVLNTLLGSSAGCRRMIGFTEHCIAFSALVDRSSTLTTVECVRFWVLAVCATFLAMPNFIIKALTHFYSLKCPVLGFIRKALRVSEGHNTFGSKVGIYVARWQRKN